MRQPATCEVLDYWNLLRGKRYAPDRDEVDPGAIRASLPDVFLLGFDAARRYPFRLAGMSVCALFGRELRDTAYMTLWTAGAAPGMADLLQSVVEDSTGAVIAVTGHNEVGQKLDLELLLLPLTCRGGERARVLGALSAPRPPYWLGVRPLVALQSGDLRFVGAAVDSLGRKFVSGRQNPLTGPGFVVYPAGAPDPISRNPQG